MMENKFPLPLCVVFFLLAFHSGSGQPQTAEPASTASQITPLQFTHFAGKDDILPSSSAAIHGQTGYRLAVDSASSGYSLLKSTSLFRDRFWIRFYFRFSGEAPFLNGADSSFPFLSLSFFKRLQKAEPHASVVLKWLFSNSPAKPPMLVCRFLASEDSAVEYIAAQPLNPRVTHCLELSLAFSKTDTLSCECYLNGEKTISAGFPYPYAKDEITVQIGKFGAGRNPPVLTADFADIAISGERIPPIPDSPRNCGDSLSGANAVLFCAPFISHHTTETIGASRFRLYSQNIPEYPLLDLTTKSSRSLYRCAVPFALDTGAYTWNAAFQNKDGVWSKWSAPETLRVDSLRPQSMEIKRCYITKPGGKAPVAELLAGTWYDLHAEYAFTKTFPMWETFFIGWLHHEDAISGNFYNKGGAFNPRRNYVLNLSFNPEKRKRVVFEKSVAGSGESRVIPENKQGLYIDADPTASRVDFNNNRLHLRFRLLDSAQAGVWYLTAFGVDPKDNRSNCVSQRILVHKKSSNFNSFTTTGTILLLLILTGLFWWLRRKKQKTMGPKEPNPAFVQLSEYVNAHIHEKTTVDQAIKDLKLNKRTFHKLVKEAGGDTFIKLVNRLKIDKSKEFLAQGKTVMETSYALGFENPGYFIKMFKEIEGKTPKEFQQK